jgi:large subunit ribosomal protein L5
VLKEKNFDNAGNLSFGIEQYVFYDNVKYDPDIGTMGLQVAVTLEKPGYRVKHRKLNKAKVGKKHQISREEAIAFIKKTFNVKIEND